MAVSAVVVKILGESVLTSLTTSGCHTQQLPSALIPPSLHVSLPDFSQMLLDDLEEASPVKMPL